ncbi:hypothetical protein PSCICM_43660 [Pseudomonas cichorii]|nr:hypothetical protein PSCICM_43660 [Pseudomonas cichorii]
MSESRIATGRYVGDFSGYWAIGLESGIESEAVGRCLGCLELGLMLVWYSDVLMGLLNQGLEK